MASNATENQNGGMGGRDNGCGHIGWLRCASRTLHAVKASSVIGDKAGRSQLLQWGWVAGYTAPSPRPATSPRTLPGVIGSTITQHRLQHYASP